MAAPTFTVEVVTPTRLVMKETATSMVAPAVDGYLGILANHAPLITELKIGHLEVTREGGQMEKLAVSGGFMEVRDNHVIVLADTAERAEEIDINRAQEAKRRAEERLAQGGSEIDITRASASLARAVNRLNLIGAE